MEAKQEEKRKVAYSYTIIHYDDKSVDVVPVDGEDGKPSISQEATFEDIIAVAEVVKENKQAQLSERSAYIGTMRALADFAKAQAEQAKPKAKVE